MAEQQDKLAESLERLKELQQGGRRIFRSNELTRTHRERLLESGFVQQIIQGWLMSSSPGTTPDDTTPWYASFWEFCRRYCTHRFTDRWHLSPQQSLLLAAEDSTIPSQVVVHAPAAHNNELDLPFDTSLFLLRDQPVTPSRNVTTHDGLRLLKPEVALVAVPANFFVQHPVEAQVVLSRMGDVSDLLRSLLEGGHSVVAGRLAGALRRVGSERQADEIVGAMEDAGFRVRETDPFSPDASTVELRPANPPIVDRIRGLWQSARDPVLEEMPPAPGLPDDSEAYLRSVEALYTRDAYHSLSIEGYQVTEGLIDRVRSGAWDPAENLGDQERRDGLAARGYWEAFQDVKEAIARILEGEAPGALVRREHRRWYRDLFGPFVRAGLLDATTLAGYRDEPVFVRGSRHVPPRASTVPDAMSALFDLLEEEPESAVRAVLGHWLLGYIHPYRDGNGRMARFLMNTMFASGGFPWTVIRVEDRGEYMTTLNRASVDGEFRPFARFIAERLEWSLSQDVGTGGGGRNERPS